jgi:AraC family transcriptional regulator
MSYQQKVGPRPRPPENWSAQGRAPLNEAALASEAGKLLEDLRVALGQDTDTRAWGAASKIAVDLAALLEANLPADGNLVEMPRVCAGLAPWQKRKVQEYIQRHLDVPISVQALAKLISLSPGYFCRAFKESFGETPHAFIMRLRIERAQEMMLTTPEPLSQIALACGHSDQAHFSRRFRQQIGETPSAWRRRNAVGNWETADGAICGG